MPLNSNHTHFILVDNQQLNEFGGEIEMRSNIESAIANYQHNGSQKIPLVVLVFGGDQNSLNTVWESVKDGSPCIIIEASIYSYLNIRMMLSIYKLLSFIM